MVFNSNYILEKFKSPAFSIFVILLFHVSGFIGLQTTSKNWFLALTPLNLLVSFFVLIRHENYRNFRFILFTLLILCLGFFIEVIGVNSGLLFGEYSYGDTLGFKVFNTPLMIAFNWFILVFCTGIVLHKTNLNVFLKVIIGAIFMTACDYIIEPVAIAYNFWEWKYTSVPFQNYLAWFGFSLLFLFLFQYSKIEKTSKVAPWLLAVQIIFFLALNLLI
jgi:putative membrane protein